MEIKSDHLSGAKQILQRCLGLSKNQSLVIFVDETTISVGTVISEAADLLGISQTTIFVPVSLQRKIPAESDLSLITQEIAREARAVLTCVNGSPECLPFRDKLLESLWSARTRIGTMPGATLDVLELANIDFDQLIADCHNIEFAMARGHTLEFISTTADGKRHVLKVDIGGWERLPVASDGIIEDGVWGNVPSGETYIAPIEGSGEGSVVINGSIPGLVIQPEQEIILYFEKGSLTRIEPQDNPTAQWLDQTQIQKAIEKKDLNWSNLAEIGIGTNPGVKQLTGNMLFDEKCAGTTHLALGLNTFMGGTIKATIHCDMVVKSPSIIINGKTILDHGRMHFVESEWHENYEQISLEGSPARETANVLRSGTEVDFYGKRLQRILRPEPGRVSTCFVGDDDTSRLAYALYANIPPDDKGISIGSLARKSEIDDETTRRVLHIMQDYSLIRLY
jgi:hypothetical protein